tara:strand:+ start:4091 stop:4876 length:786 start_codon:yes stop_codon:yes gene_type:complete
MLDKPIQELSLDECNEELEFIGAARRFESLYHARVKIWKLVNKGEIHMADEAKAITDDKKLKEKPKPVWGTSEYENRRVHTPKGPGLIVSEDKKLGVYKVKLERDPQDEVQVTIKSTRFKAVDDSYRDKYEVDNAVKTESGAPSINNGDDVAQALMGLTSAELSAVANENGLKENWDKWTKNKLNPGMKRMNLGNMLRRKANKGEKVTIVGKAPAAAAKSNQSALDKTRDEHEKKKKENEKKRLENLKKQREKQAAKKKAA